jgi:hypothetical protein
MASALQAAAAAASVPSSYRGFLDIDWRDVGGDLQAWSRGGVRQVWAPQPGSQEYFLKCPVDEVLYEGNRGPGKTDGLLFDFFQDVGVGWGADWVGILFRKTYPELQDVIEKSRKWFKQVSPAARFNEAKSEWTFPDGEKLYFRQFAKPADYWKYHGHAYPWIAWEELCTYATDECFKSMFSCSRSTRQGIPIRIRSTANPYGPGHNWVKMRYQLPVLPGQIAGRFIADARDSEGQLEPPRMAIHGNLDENQILLRSQPGYKAKIRASARNPAELAAWLYGSWDIVAGGMFDDVWARCRHASIVRPFDIPEEWRLDRSMDWGSSKPSSIGFWAESNGEDYMGADGRWHGTVKGDLFRVGEIYTWTGKPNEGSRALNTDISRMIVEYEVARGWRTVERSRVRPGPGDSSMFNENASGDGTSIHDDLVKTVRLEDGRTYRGPAFVEADKGKGSRKQGWQQMREWIASCLPKDGAKAREKPGLFVFSNCEQFLRTVPVLPRDEKDMDDVDTEAEDHVGDEVRYRLRAAKKPPANRTAYGLGG